MASYLTCELKQTHWVWLTAEIIEDNYAAVNEMLGRPTKVTPSSKVVGDLALHLVGTGVDPADFEENPTKYDIPDSVISFLRGELGTLQSNTLRDKILSSRNGELQLSDVPEEEAVHLNSEDSAERRPALNRLLFPKQWDEFNEFRRHYGNTEALNDADFFHGLTEGEERIIHLFPEGSNDRADLKQMVVRLDAVGAADEKGLRSVILNVNGQIRPLKVRDNSVESVTSTVERPIRKMMGTWQHHFPASLIQPFRSVMKSRPATRSLLLKP